MTSVGYVTCCSKITLKVDIICLELAGVKSFGVQHRRRRTIVISNVFFMENHSSPPPPTQTLKSHEPARGYRDVPMFKCLRRRRQLCYCNGRREHHGPRFVGSPVRLRAAVSGLSFIILAGYSLTEERKSSSTEV